MLNHFFSGLSRINLRAEKFNFLPTGHKIIQEDYLFIAHQADDSESCLREIPLALRTPLPVSSPKSRNPGLLTVVGDPYASIFFSRGYSARLCLLTPFLGFGSNFG